MRFKIGSGLGVAAVVASLILSSAPAYAVGENANATAIQSTLADIPINLAQANCPGPSNTPQSTLPLLLGPIAVGVGNAQCGNTFAQSSIASLRIFDSSDPNNTVVLDAINASCNSDGTFSSTVTVALGNTQVNAGPITTPLTIETAGLAIYLNEHTTDGGFNGVNAVRIRLAGPEQNQNLILAQARCGTASTSTANARAPKGLSLFGLKLF
ncbi:MAG: hypothetical protein M3159_00740 [Actinomycetota bacterium]|nr:hypothetical protein [Actinomycetota bacterium]